MTKIELASYLDRVRRDHQLPIFISRQFRAREEWDRVSAFDSFRLHGMFRDSNPDLPQVLNHKRTVLIGEPGLGKTVLARRSAVHFADVGVVPVFARLSSYRGTLADLLRTAARDVAGVTVVEGEGLRFAYILDGLDEVPANRTGDFLRDLRALIDSEPDAHVVLTCRQAVYEGFRKEIPPTFREFFPLGFNEDDILAYAEQSGIPPAAFADELERSDLTVEASIPFVLSELIEVFEKHQRLGDTRSDNLHIVTEELLGKRTRFAARKQGNALQVLGLSMELYSRNELSTDEAVKVLEAGLSIPSTEAAQLLDELTQTLLLTTATGIRFQVRSFGEYFAARKLEFYSLPQVLDYCRFRGTFVLNPTWINTISYLIEMSPKIRGHFVHKHPDWVLPASGSALSPREQETVLTGVIEQLATAGQDLLGSAAFSHHRLARLLKPPDAGWLRAQFNGPEPARQANALLLLGHLKDPQALITAMDWAVDATVSPMLRRAAFGAISIGGKPEMIPALLEHWDHDDPWESSYLAAAASIVTPDTLGILLAALARTHTYVVQVNLRLKDIRSRETLDAVLQFYLDDPRRSSDRNLAQYAKPVWMLVRKYADEGILAKIGFLLAAFERGQVHSGQSDIESDLLDALDAVDPEGIVSRTALEIIISEGLDFRYSAFSIAKLCTPAVVAWLLDRDAPQDLLMQLASYANNEVRGLLREATGGLVEAQDEHRRLRTQEEADRVAQELAVLRGRLDVIANGERGHDVFRAFFQMGASQWPELAANRIVWLARAVSERLVAEDALHTVKWLSESRLTLPRILSFLVDLSGYYGLPVDNDVLLVQALLGVNAKSLIEFHRKRPLSRAALTELERFLSDPATPAGAIDHFVSFLAGSEVYSPAIEQSLERLVLLPAQGVDPSGLPVIENNRRAAANILAAKASDSVLLGLRKQVKGQGIESLFLGVLTARQHVPTIFERLGRILSGSDRALRTAELPFPSETELQWISKVRTNRAWNLLAKLRERVLRLELANLSMLMEGTLAEIDKKRVIGLMQEQLDATPDAWKDSTEQRMHDYERELTFGRAAQISLDEVLARLGDSVIEYKVKLLCEGSSDKPVFESLFARLGLGAIRVHPINGWPNVLTPNFDVGLFIEGFQHAELVLDGDCGRDWQATGHPLNENAREVAERLERAGVPVHVLKGYGIESYFNQKAVEMVLGRDLSSCFPLDPAKAIEEQIAGYDKGRNGEIAGQMEPDDFDGTDLGDIIRNLRKHVEDHR
jgi:hypothetical protein